MSLQARFVDSLQQVPEAAWDALLPAPNPFLCWRFLRGLEQHDCLRPRYGWRSQHLLLEDGGELVAALPCYLKANSHGEFVFDQRWAMAYEQHGLNYYPKLLGAVPYSPVNGPRLLARGDDPALRETLRAALVEVCSANGLSSAHITFHREAEHSDDPRWLRRFDWQFHWHRRGWTCFEDFLAALSSKKRKNLRQERAQVQRAGITVERLTGATLDEASMDVMVEFYLDTFTRKGNLPALSRNFFQHLRTAMADNTLLVLARRHGQPIAGALFLFDETCLYGRYWGAFEEIPGLHFELCYHQGIEFCLERGIDVFEPGAQGEHKLARGFLPSMTHSSHYIADPRFRRAIADSLKDEARWQHGYRDELMTHSPYREEAGA